jgi:hypothetical protein
MTYVGESANPWDVPTNLAIEKMQAIWDATGSIDYKVTGHKTNIVYKKVHIRFVLDHKLTSTFRPFNASPTLGEALLALTAWLLSSHFSIPMLNGLQMKLAYILRRAGSMAFVLHTGKLNATIEK